jgi:hypothetical protein
MKARILPEFGQESPKIGAVLAHEHQRRPDGRSGQ